MIDAKFLTLTPHERSAVAYHADDCLSIRPGFTRSMRDNIKEHLQARQVRTVFVTKAEAINRFLIWLHQNLVP